MKYSDAQRQRAQSALDTVRETLAKVNQFVDWNHAVKTQPIFAEALDLRAKAITKALLEKSLINLGR